MSSLSPSQINEKYSIKNKDWKFYHSIAIDLCERIKTIMPSVSENISIYRYEGVYGHYERINKTYTIPDNTDPWNREFKLPPSSNSILTHNSYSINKIISNKIVRGVVRVTSVESNLIYCLDYLWIHEDEFNLN